VFLTFFMKNNVLGLTFALLWATASVVTKYGLKSAQPLVIADVRFIIAGMLMIFGAILLRGYRLPNKTEWQPLILYGFLNVTLYLGLFGIAIQYVAAGIGTLAIALSPLFISILSALWLKKHVPNNVWLGLVLGMLGVGVATYPLLLNSYAKPLGIVLLLFCMLIYAIGTVYYSSRKWDLPILVINGWQVLFGGILLFPLVYFTYEAPKNHYNTTFWGTIAWLVVGVSIGAVQLWLYLLKIDAVKAALWLFLCPIFGFFYAWLLLGEPVSSYTFVGTGFVIGGLYWGQRKG
jgi:probable blue pigment (indigoidine) exporter